MYIYSGVESERERERECDNTLCREVRAREDLVILSNHLALVPKLYSTPASSSSNSLRTLHVIAQLCRSKSV